MNYTQPDVTHDRWYEFVVTVTLKINQGSFGIRYDRQGEFSFCAQSAHDARAIAGHHVKDAVSSIGTTRMVEIVDAMRISTEVFPVVHAPLKSLSEHRSKFESIIDEDELEEAVR